jgi:VanZ family protein
LLPFHYTYRPLEEALEAFRRMPLADPADLRARGDWVISAVLFTALSYLTLAALGVDRPRRVGRRAALAVVAGCAALSVAIEFVQLYFPLRAVSLNDILVGSLGGVIGACTWLAAGQWVTEWLRQLGQVTTVSGLARRLLPGYLGALLVVQVMPFDFVVGADELAVKFAEGKVRLIPGSGPEGVSGALARAALSLACFLPIGLLRGLVRSRATSPRPTTLGVVLAAPALVELLQLFVYSRTFHATDVFAGMAGVYAGWRLGRAVRTTLRTSPEVLVRGSGAGRGLWPLLVVGWLGAVIYLYWQPFDFTADPARFTTDPDDFSRYGFRRLVLAPFADCYWSSKYNALDLFVRKALLFMPLGVFAALSQHDVYRHGLAVRLLLTTLAVAAVLEGGRYFLPSHSPSVTDLLLACAGAWLGYRLTQHIRATFWADISLYGWMRLTRGRHPTA